MQDWDETLLSQYANSPIINALIESFNDAMDPAADIAAFQRYVWNVNSAVGDGLKIWGKIIGVSPNIPNYTEVLTDEDYRLLILVKAAANIGNVTIPTLNKLLSQIFTSSSGTVYVQDNLNMTITYVFSFGLTASQIAIVENSGVVPRPAGVEVLLSIPGQLFEVTNNVATALFTPI
jgi:hypothetical protein